MSTININTYCNITARIEYEFLPFKSTPWEVQRSYAASEQLVEVQCLTCRSQLKDQPGDTPTYAHNRSLSCRSRAQQTSLASVCCSFYLNFMNLRLVLLWCYTKLKIITVDPDLLAELHVHCGRLCLCALPPPRPPADITVLLLYWTPPGLRDDWAYPLWGSRPHLKSRNWSVRHLWGWICPIAPPETQFCYSWRA